MVKRFSSSRSLTHWDAEDLAAWEAGGKTIEVRVLGVDERTSNSYTLNISVQ